MRHKKENKEIVVIDNTDKVPPQDVVTERMIIGAILLESKSKYSQRILQFAKPEHFYKEAHRIVFNAMIEIWRKDEPVDILTVVNYLRNSGQLNDTGDEHAKGPAYIATLTNNLASSESIVHWFFNIVYPYYLRRKMIEVSARGYKTAHDMTSDVFDDLSVFVEELEQCKPDVAFKPSHSAKAMGDEFLAELGVTEAGEVTEEKEVAPIKKYLTGHKKFDEVVSICEDKVVLIGGHKGSLKSRLTNEVVTTLMERYPKEIACLWVSLEDSWKEQLRTYLSRKIFIRPEDIKFGTFDKLFKPKMAQWVKQWKSFDMQIHDQSIRIKGVGSAFKQFVSERPDKLCILIIDNVLSLADKDDFKYSTNEMYDFIGLEILNIKRSTHALIFAVHHYNEEVANKAECVNGYRPRLTALKGTEVWKRVAFQTLLLNRPSFYPDLMSSYNDKAKDVLGSLLIVDVATNRGRTESDKELIRFFINGDYRLFQEVDDNYEMEEPDEPVKVPVSRDTPF